MEVKNFHLTLQMKSPMKILKILIFNFSYMIRLLKFVQIPRQLNFNLNLQKKKSLMKILKY